MATAEQIREGFEKMAKTQGPTTSNIAKVKSVDEDAATCVLLDEDGLEIFDVRLRPVLSGNKSMMLLPKVGTYVLAIRIEDDDDWMVLAADEITKIGYYVDRTSLILTDKIHLSANGQVLSDLVDSLFAALGNMVFATPSGPTTGLANIAEFEALKLRFQQLLN